MARGRSAMGVNLQAGAIGRPTRRQLETLVAYIDAGSIVAAAHELGIAETTVRQHLSGLYRRTGCLNAAQAAYWLGRAETTEIRGRAKVAPVSGRRHGLRDEPLAPGTVAGVPVTQETDGRSRASTMSRGPVR